MRPSSNRLLVLIALGSCLLFPQLGTGEGPQTRELPLDMTAETLRARVVAAIGDETAWKHLLSTRSRGIVEFGGIGGEGKVEAVGRTPNLAWTRIVLPGGEESSEGCDGRVAWEKDASGVRELRGVELREALFDCEFLAPLALARHYKDFKLIGKGGQKDLVFYLVDAFRAGGEKEALTIDARTYLPMLVVIERAIDGQRALIATHLADYRSVGGLKLPHLLRSKVGTATITIRLESIEPNPTIDAVVFARPKS